MYYSRKDEVKFSICSALITRGANGSSSDKYRRLGVNGLDLKLNPSLFSTNETVGVSVNGRRSGRISFDRDLVQKAIGARCRIVTDNKYHRSRGFNLGERELAVFLTEQGYIAQDYPERAIWEMKREVRQ